MDLVPGVRIAIVIGLALSGCVPERALRDASPSSEPGVLVVSEPLPEPTTDNADSTARHRRGAGPVADENGVYRLIVGGAITQPRLLERGDFDHERFKGKEFRGGSVSAEMVINADGMVQDVTLLRSLDPEIDEDFLKSLHQYRFEPATLNGEPVPVSIVMTRWIHVDYFGLAWP
jgi:hypothetical protein